MHVERKKRENILQNKNYKLNVLDTSPLMIVTAELVFAICGLPHATKMMIEGFNELLVNFEPINSFAVILQASEETLQSRRKFRGYVSSEFTEERANRLYNKIFHRICTDAKPSRLVGINTDELSPEGGELYVKEFLERMLKARPSGCPLQDGLKTLSEFASESRVLQVSFMKVAMFYNIKGWAWWHRIQNIKKHIKSDIIIDGVKIGDSFDHRPYDFVVVFEARYVAAAGNTPPSKLIVGCSCPPLLPELKRCVNEINPVAVVVNNTKMWLEASEWSRCFNCPNGVDTDTFYPPEKVECIEQSVWIGDSNALVDKGLGLIQQACEIARYPLRVVEMSEVLNKGGLLSHEELRDHIYHRASVLLCASEAEGTPNPALEALACGVPVISSEVGNMPEIIQNGKNGFLVARQIKEIVKALTLLRNSDANIMCENAWASVRANWAWQTQSEKYAAMFFDILN